MNKESVFGLILSLLSFLSFLQLLCYNYFFLLIENFPFLLFFLFFLLLVVFSSCARKREVTIIPRLQSYFFINQITSTPPLVIDISWQNSLNASSKQQLNKSYIHDQLRRDVKVKNWQCFVCSFHKVEDLSTLLWYNTHFCWGEFLLRIP